MRRRTIYNPHNTLLLAVLLLILLVVGGLVLVGALSLAFLDVGLSPTATALILLGTFVGGFINIPLLRLESTMPIVREEFVRFFGIMYRVPEVEYEETSTLVAINVGGAFDPKLCLNLPPMEASFISPMELGRCSRCRLGDSYCCETSERSGHSHARPDITLRRGLDGLHPPFRCP